MKVTGSITYTKVKGSVIIGTYYIPEIPDDIPEGALVGEDGLPIFDENGDYIIT